jgi:hypothetical protein
MQAARTMQPVEIVAQERQVLLCSRQWTAREINCCLHVGSDIRVYGDRFMPQSKEAAVPSPSDDMPVGRLSEILF